MTKLTHIFTILAIYGTSEVTSTEDNAIRTHVDVIDLNPPSARDVSDGEDCDRVHSRVRRASDFSTSDQQAILDKHNELRSQVSPEASNMIYMQWDEDLATMAQDWSDMCNYDHGNPTNISPFTQVGQNLFLGGGSANNPLDGVGPVQAWYNEVQYYTHATATCETGRVCGHYTQVVWAETYAVGCGYTFCSSTTQGNSNVWLMTCNYGPAGNTAGKQAYLGGLSCTECSSGSDQCYENQCRSCSEHNDVCICNQVCENCGTLNADCTCTCQQGFIGGGCSDICEDMHSNCGNGWFPAQCSLSFVMNNCPKMCGYCQDAEPDFVCIETPASTPCPCIRHIPPGI